MRETLGTLLVGLGRYVVDFGELIRGPEKCRDCVAGAVHPRGPNCEHPALFPSGMPPVTSERLEDFPPTG